MATPGGSGVFYDKIFTQFPLSSARNDFLGTSNCAYCALVARLDSLGRHHESLRKHCWTLVGLSSCEGRKDQ
jgi:hypothetical protein